MAGDLEDVVARVVGVRDHRARHAAGDAAAVGAHVLMRVRAVGHEPSGPRIGLRPRRHPPGRRVGDHRRAARVDDRVARIAPEPVVAAGQAPGRGWSAWLPGALSALAQLGGCGPRWRPLPPRCRRPGRPAAPAARAASACRSARCRRCPAVRRPCAARGSRDRGVQRPLLPCDALHHRQHQQSHGDQGSRNPLDTWLPPSRYRSTRMQQCRPVHRPVADACPRRAQRTARPDSPPLVPEHRWHRMSRATAASRSVVDDEGDIVPQALPADGSNWRAELASDARNACAFSSARARVGHRRQEFYDQERRQFAIQFREPRHRAPRPCSAPAAGQAGKRGAVTSTSDKRLTATRSWTPASRSTASGFPGSCARSPSTRALASK